MSNEIHLESVWTAIDGALPRFSAEDAQAALAVYHELASGEPLDTVALAERLHVTVAEATEILDRDSLRCLAYRDERGRVVGLGGLAVLPMHHVLNVDGRTLYTWCAWDVLFLPDILGSPAEVTSQCPETGRAIRVRIGPDGVERAEPETAVLTFLSPEAATFDRSAANVMTRFCPYVFFLADRHAGKAWTARRPGTFLCSLEDGYALGQRLNARNFGPALAGREADAAEEGR